MVLLMLVSLILSFMTLYLTWLPDSDCFCMKSWMKVFDILAYMMTPITIIVIVITRLCTVLGQDIHVLVMH